MKRITDMKRKQRCTEDGKDYKECNGLSSGKATHIRGRSTTEEDTSQDETDMVDGTSSKKFNRKRNLYDDQSDVSESGRIFKCFIFILKMSSYTAASFSSSRSTSSVTLFYAYLL